MKIILYLSVALIAVGFFILVISLIRTLKAMKGTLESVSKTLEGLESQLDGVTRETTELLHKTNVLAEDIQVKVEKLDTVVDAVRGVGQTVRSLNNSLMKATTSVTATMGKNQEKIAQIVQWSAAVKEIKDKWFRDKESKIKGRNPNTGEVIQNNRVSRERG